MKVKRYLYPLIVALAMILTTVSGAAATPLPPDIDPANFVDIVDNEFFPLTPGTTLIYEGTTEGVSTRNETFVTHKTKQILGVDCIVVHDRAFENGLLVEDTFDWYAQDVDGNVWYFGEDTKELDPNGNVISTEGSWEAGVDGAKAAIIMEADPQEGDRYYQEFARGVAEDQARVISLNEVVCVAYDCYNEVLLTKEWTRLEPGVTEQKYYAKGVGFILGIMVKGGNEQTELVSITP